MYCEHREHNRNTNVLKGSLFSTPQGLWQAYIILGGIKMEYASWKLSNSMEKLKNWIKPRSSSLVTYGFQT